MTVIETRVSTKRSEMRIMERGGERKILWDRFDPDEVANARRVFDEFRADRFCAYSLVGRDRGDLIREFDPEAEVIVLSPPLVGG